MHRKFLLREKWLCVSIGKPEEMRAFVTALLEFFPAHSAQPRVTASFPRGRAARDEVPISALRRNL